MRKKTIYITDELKEQLETLAKSEGRSEAELIREILSNALAGHSRPEPQVPLPGLRLGDPNVAERVDQLLEGVSAS